jgi:hypothetical protein
MIKLWDAVNLPLEDLEKLAYSTDDSIVVSIRMVRAVVTRARDAEREHAADLQSLQDKLDDTEARLTELEDAE